MSIIYISLDNDINIIIIEHKTYGIFLLEFSHLTVIAFQGNGKFVGEKYSQTEFSQTS